MSRNEDYLDNLLTSVTDKLNQFDDDFEQNRESLKQSYQTQNDLPRKTQSALDEVREDNFLKEFEDDLQAGKTEADFIREFEQELNGEAEGMYDLPQMDNFVNQMEEIMDQADGPDEEGIPLEVDTLSPTEDESLEDIFQDTPGTDELENITAGLDLDDDLFAGMEDTQEETIAVPKGMESLEDILDDVQASAAIPQPADGSTPPADENVTVMQQESVPPMEETGAPQPPKEQMQESQDVSLEQILNESDDEALSQLGVILDTEEETNTVEPPLKEGDQFATEPDFAYDESAAGGEEKSGKKKKKERDPNSLIAKLSRMFFGTAEELNPEMAAEIEKANAKTGVNQENLDPAALKEQKKQEKELKKQQKKEAAEQKKKEKEAAKAEKDAQKASKPKKEKKPKKKLPKEPPLPKVPVMMMWTLALSIMVLVLLGSSLIGYSTTVKASQEAFDNGDYVTAYTKLQGVKVKAADEDLYHAAVALAGIQTELDAYTALMEQKQYEMALDALVRGIGRCGVHSAEAEEWGVSDQLTAMEKKLNKLLKEQFDVSKRKAKKLYKIQKRSDYTLELHKILAGLGLY